MWVLYLGGRRRTVFSATLQWRNQNGAFLGHTHHTFVFNVHSLVLSGCGAGWCRTGRQKRRMQPGKSWCSSSRSRRYTRITSRCRRQKSVMPVFLFCFVFNHLYAVFEQLIDTTCKQARQWGAEKQAKTTKTTTKKTGYGVVVAVSRSSCVAPVRGTKTLPHPLSQRRSGHYYFVLYLLLDSC